jgi:hypothetical protein
MKTLAFSRDRQNVINKIFAKWISVAACAWMTTASQNAGLPDLSWYNIPRRKNIPNGHKISEMAVK